MKERMKKSFAMLLCVLMCLSLLPEVHVHAEDAAGDEAVDEAVIVADTQGEEETTAAPEEAIAAVEAAEGTAEPVTEPDVEAAPVSAAVRVSFNCTPAETLIWVYDAEDEDTELEPEEDGSYLLVPGEYVYVAFCEGYTGVYEELAVEESDEDLVVDVVLEVSDEALEVAPYHSVVMTADEFIQCLKTALNRNTKYNNTYPYNVGYYDGSVISWDCWNLGKSIIWSNGAVVSNYTTGNYVGNGITRDQSCGLGDWSGTGILQACETYSSDFSSIEPGEWLFMGSVSNIYHVGYYVGNGKVIECTGGSFQKVIESNIDSNGYSSTTLNTWSYHAKVPWLDYTSSDYLSKCTPYPAGGVIQMTTSAWLWSLPCSDETDSSSVHVSSEKIASGTYLNVTGLYKNVTNDTNPHYWYRLTWDGQTAYVYAPYTTFVGIDNSSITVTDIDNPSSLTVGDRFWIKGVISSPYLLLTNVTAYVLNSSGGVVLSSPDNPNSHSYSLYQSTVDDNLTFNTLSAGTYRYFVGLTIQGYYVDSSNALKTTSSDIVANGLDTYFTVSEAGHTHSYTTTVVAPTCTEAGYTLHSCSCGYSYKDNTVAAKGHSYGSAVTKQATCTEAGIKTYTCSVCGDSYTESIAALGHTYTSQTIGGSCTQRPSVKYTCTRCGDTYTEYADGNWSEWSTTKPSGVPESAIQTKTQYRYRDKETTTSSSSTLDGWTLSGSETVWSDYGAWSAWSTNYVAESESTQVETRTGYHYYYYVCSNCGAHMHGYGTCYTWAGGCGQSTISSGSYHSARYDTPYSSSLDWHGTGVNYIESSDGKVFAYTSTSSQHYVAPATEYRSRTRTQSTIYSFYRWTDWSSWSDTAATASDSREVETRQMYRYDLYATAEHSWDSGVVTTAAGCESEGVMTYTCTACGETRTETIPTTGHSWGEWVVTKEPTLTTDGVETRTCQVCGETETRSVAAVIYTVSYNANGGSGAPASQQKLKGAALTLSSTKPTRSGYTFLGWAASSTATAAQYQPGGSYTADKDVTLYAVWKKAGVEKGQLTVSTPQARPGETVAVDVSIAENPGICAFTIQVDYDDTVLELVSIEHPEIGSNSIWNINGGMVSWLSFSDSDYNGTLFTVTFKVADNAEEGTTAVTVLYESGDIGNFAEEEINPSVQAGGVNIVNRVPGDTNGDGRLNTMDLIRLMKYFNGESVEVVPGSADINGDGRENTMDLIRLMKYISGEDVEIH